MGSTSYITDASGEVYQHLEYFAFGETFVEEHSNTNRTPYLYNGKELDDETGLYYYGARYYDPRTSMFPSVDRFAEKYSNISPYNYCANNPIRNIEANGDSIIKVTIGHSKYLQGAKEIYIDHTIAKDVNDIFDYANNGIHLHINSSFRTNKKQSTLNSSNATTPTKPGNSPHNAGLGIDFNVYTNNDLGQGTSYQNKAIDSKSDIIKYAKSLGWRWGGEFSTPDPIHIDKRGSNDNFTTIRDANQLQMSGNTNLNVDESLIKRTDVYSPPLQRLPPSNNTQMNLDGAVNGLGTSSGAPIIMF